MKQKALLFGRWRSLLLLVPLTGCLVVSALASSHRKVPLIANDPNADNTDVNAFRSLDDTATMVTIIANYIPFQLSEGGPDFYNFRPNVRYEIHIKNRITTIVDDITYPFTFAQVNEATITFFDKE